MPDSLAPQGDKVERFSRSREVGVGTWVWVLHPDADDVDDQRWLGCVTHVGSNFIEVTSPHSERQSYHEVRIHFSDMPEEIEVEKDPDKVIAENVKYHQLEVQSLLQKAQNLLQDLGLRARSLPDAPASENANALAIASQALDIKAHKRALVRAKDKTIPDIFKQIQSETSQMATWMSARAMGLQSSLGPVEDVIKEIGDRVFTVELYAGLLEDVKQVREGSPAGLDQKLHIMQRRCYMDEECLLDYQAGGMDFNSLRKFESWLGKSPQFERVFPFPRCMAAFRVRRTVKEREWDGTFAGAFQLVQMADSDKYTFLYIRNGDQLHRLRTEIEFGPKLFPGRDEMVLTDKMWGEIDFHEVKDIITDGHYQEITKEEKKRKALEEKWDQTHPEDEHWKNPHRAPFSHHEFEPLDSSSVYFDDMNQVMKDRIRDYNRIAYIVQGIFDRSMMLHPHPPARLWTQEGFDASLALVYDDDRVLYPSAEPPDFLAYVAKCNESLKAGSVTIGQDEFWVQRETKRYNESRNWRQREHDLREYRPSGNPGPGYIARVADWRPRVRQAVYHWVSERAYSWGGHWGKDPNVNKALVVPADQIFNISAYKPGDFKQFFTDPRTREGYLKWAGVLMAAEDYHAGVLKVGDHRG